MREGAPRGQNTAERAGAQGTVGDLQYYWPTLWPESYWPSTTAGRQPKMPSDEAFRVERVTRIELA